MQSQTIETSTFQRNVLRLPEEVDVFLGGGRGGGKSFAEALVALRHIEQYSAEARVLYIRRSYKGLADFELVCRLLFAKVYGQAARYNQADHVWRFPNGAYMELGQLETAGDYTKYQGRSFTLLLADEIGQFETPDLLDILRSNLRGPTNIPLRAVFAANPGGPGHAWIAQRYVFKAAPWAPFLEAKSKRHWVYAPSTYLGNQFIDRNQYRDQLESSCPHDPELLKAWVYGDWTVSRGAYFANVLDESRNAVTPWKAIPKILKYGRFESQGHPWRHWLAHDFGSSAPSVTYIVVQSPGAIGPDEKFYPRDSMILVDELATSKPDRPNEGLGYTVPVLAELILEMCKRWSIQPEGVADDAIFAKGGHAAGSIAEEFRRSKVYFHPARKADRITGWNVMRRLLANAGKPDVPGLYVSRSCTYFWQTVPYLGRDIKRVEDVDSTGPDHGADAVRYGCSRMPEMSFTEIVGT